MGSKLVMKSSKIVPNIFKIGSKKFKVGSKFFRIGPKTVNKEKIKKFIKILRNFLVLGGLLGFRPGPKNFLIQMVTLEVRPQIHDQAFWRSRARILCAFRSDGLEPSN